MKKGFVRVRGARENNLRVDVEIPRDALVVFTGVSGSGKSSLAFGTLYPLRRGAASLPRVGVAVCAAPVRSDAGARGRRDRRPAAGGRTPAAARHADDELPTVPVYAGLTPPEARRALQRKEEPSYMGTFTGARRHVFHSFSSSQSALMKKRALQYMLSSDCSECRGKRLRRESLSVTFAGLDIAELSRLPLKRLATIFAPYAAGTAADEAKQEALHPEKVIVIQRIAEHRHRARHAGRRW